MVYPMGYLVTPDGEQDLTESLDTSLGNDFCQDPGSSGRGITLVGETYSKTNLDSAVKAGKERIIGHKDPVQKVPKIQAGITFDHRLYLRQWAGQ